LENKGGESRLNTERGNFIDHINEADHKNDTLKDFKQIDSKVEVEVRRASKTNLDEDVNLNGKDDEKESVGSRVDYEDIKVELNEIEPYYKQLTMLISKLC